MTPPLTCFHCAEPLPDRVLRPSVRINGDDVSCCCAGCEAAALLISGAGLGDYYRWRSMPAPRPAESVGDPYTPFDRDEVLAHQPRTADGHVTVQLLFEGLRCPACGWLIEQRLTQLPGVRGLRVNPATARGELVLNTAQTPLSTVLRTVGQLGYVAHLLGGADTLGLATRERREALKRLVVAGFGMMQVMMIAVGLYAGAFHGIEPVVRQYLRVISMIIATPVLAYCAWPLVRGALAGLRIGQATMDLPVTLGLAAAYSVSVADTLTGRGEVYFDSATMFVFFLLLGRYVEMVARHQAGSATDALTRILPVSARRICPDGREEDVPLAALVPGDCVRVSVGAALPADGVLASGVAELDEALLTGEDTAVVRRVGDPLIAGSVNVGATLTLTVTATGSATVLAAVARLLERATSDRPRLARVADRVAGLFLRYLLLAAGMVGLVWLVIDPARAFDATFAILVVACPCALSLATPVAVAAATSRLARDGLLITRADAPEALATTDMAVLDKTGTLTCGAPGVGTVTPLSGLGVDGCLSLAASLEQGCGHPLARSFDAAEARPVSGQRVIPGSGVEGSVDGRRLRIGRADFVAELAGPMASAPGDEGIYLGSEGEWLAHISIEDSPLASAAGAVAGLRARGLGVCILSGDSEGSVRRVAQRLGITAYRSRAQPSDKVAVVNALRAEGHRVLVVGDGVNDAPGLAAAHVSVAMGCGSALAQATADIVLAGHRLDVLAPAIDTARRTLAVVRQNLVWAAFYNALSLPAAALGFLPPWLAALGMSLSSLVVVLNASRLVRHPTSGRDPRQSQHLAAASAEVYAG